MESTYPRGPWSSSPALQLIIKTSLAPLLLPKWGLKKNVGAETLNLVSAQKFCFARCTHEDNCQRGRWWQRPVFCEARGWKNGSHLTF